MVKERIYGLDLIRTIAFLAIIVFHWSWVHWLVPPSSFSTSVERFIEIYARFFSFSGFTILFLSSFLIGFKSKESRKASWLPLFLVGGWILFSLCTYFKEGTFSLEWDIYPLLGVGILLGKRVLEWNQRQQMISIACFLGLLMLPVWHMQNLKILPSPVIRILFGECPQDYADWPIFPWLALVCLGMVLGLQTRKFIDAGGALECRKWEPALGFLILLYYWHFKDAYFHTDLGDAWSCFTFRQKPSVFWAHMLFWMAWMRISFLPSVQKTLRSSFCVRMISNLEIHRNFYLAYLLHYILLFFLMGIFDTGKTPRLSIAVCLALFPLTELATRIVLRLKIYFVGMYSA